ncbi:MAG: hypothetical protein HYX54_08300 [Chloroflexi bacterium]|nr:hypothetical protein [Chloroflexota bacterium]
MIFIDRPCCDEPLAIDLPIADTLSCEACSTTWEVTDAGPVEGQRAA